MQHKKPLATKTGAKTATKEAPVAAVEKASDVYCARERTGAWLAKHGFRTKQLQLSEWLPAIGFRHCDGATCMHYHVHWFHASLAAYVDALNKSVEALYSQALFERFPLVDGRVLNVSLDLPLCQQCVPHVLVQYQHQIPHESLQVHPQAGRVAGSVPPSPDMADLGSAPRIWHHRPRQGV